METFLFDQIIFGPVKSRRLGNSLGINLLPLTKKLCNFDCIYCECGLNHEHTIVASKLPEVEVVLFELERVLKKMAEDQIKLDVLTFAGNGEPTLHPGFSEILEGTLVLRDNYFSSAKVSVLSNATMLHKASVIESLKKVDQNILKLDSGILETIQLLNRPVRKINLEDLTLQMKQFKGELIIQTMFVRGQVGETFVDNTTDVELKAWKDLIQEIAPTQVMIYSIDRNTPFDGLEKVSLKELHSIAKLVEAVGIEVQVAG